VASATMMRPIDYLFMKFVANYEKRYETVEEFAARLEIFEATDNHINTVNDPMTRSTYTAAHNRFSDWTQEEFSAMQGLKNMTKPDFEAVEGETAPFNLPTSVDWRQEGMVTPVKDQGSCGSCWAFSAVEAIESAWMIAGNSQVILSPQELVDCTLTPVTENEGCNGGWYFWSYDWLKDNSIMKESDYPYTAKV